MATQRKVSETPRLLTKLATGRGLRAMAEIKWFKDLSTAQGEVSHRHTTIKDYLKSLDIYDPARRTVDFSSDSVAIAIQRSEIAIKGNHIKSEMLASLLQGGTIPALSLHEDSDGQLSILDGLQRTHVLAFGLENLQRWHEGKTAETTEFVQEMMTKLGDRLLSLDAYLARPVFLTVYRSLSESEMVKLFIVLNVGQQRVSIRHLLEALNHPLEELFNNKWGITTRTEKGERQAGKPRGRRPKAELPPYKLEYVVNSARAYLTKYQHVKSSKAMTDAYGDGEALVEMGPNLVKSLMELGDDTTMKDFQWVFHDLARAIAYIYKGNSKWENAIAHSDNFCFPLIAALAKARETEKPEVVEARKKELLGLMFGSGQSSDPLKLSEPKGESIDSILESKKANIAGKACRNIVFGAMRDFFRDGPASEKTILDWVAAENRQ